MQDKDKPENDKFVDVKVRIYQYQCPELFTLIVNPPRPHDRARILRELANRGVITLPGYDKNVSPPHTRVVNGISNATKEQALSKDLLDSIGIKPLE